MQSVPPVEVCVGVYNVRVGNDRTVVTITSLSNRTLDRVTLTAGGVTLSSSSRTTGIGIFTTRITSFMQRGSISQVTVGGHDGGNRFTNKPAAFGVRNIFRLLRGYRIALLSPRAVGTRGGGFSFTLPTALGGCRRRTCGTTYSTLVGG